MRNLKAIALLLILANVGYYLYVRAFAPPPSPSPPPAPAAAVAVAGRQKVPDAPPPPAAPASALRCVSVGPFGEQSESSRAEATLRGGGYAPRQRTAVGEIAEGVFVYVPIPATPAAAAMQRKLLKGAGFADAPEVPGPAGVGVISLGVFNDPKRGQARLAQAQAAGLPAQSLERRHSATTYWLDVDLKPSDAPLTAADLHSDATHGTPLTVGDCPPAPAAPVAADAHSGASVAR